MECLTKEQLLEAGKVNEKVKEALTKLFPEVFEEEKYFDLEHLPFHEGYTPVFPEEAAKKAGFMDNNFFQIRNSCEYAGKSFFLDDYYNWKLERDSQGALCLIPTKK